VVDSVDVMAADVSVDEVTDVTTSIFVERRRLVVEARIETIATSDLFTDKLTEIPFIYSSWAAWLNC
jgi:hypothetical protein